MKKTPQPDRFITAFQEYQDLFLNNIRDAISIIDVKSMRIVAVNRTFCKSLGYKKKDVIGRRCYEVTHLHDSKCSGPDDPCPLVKTLRTGSSSVFEHIHCHKDGHKVFMEVSVSPIRNERGDIIFALHIARDITQRKNTEDELQKLKKAVENSGEAIFLTDRDGTFLYVNPEFTNLYGFSQAEVVGKRTPRILKSGKMKAENYAKFWKRINEGAIIKGEVINKTRDGRLLEIGSTVSPIFDNQGALTGFLAIQRDITNRKQDEKRLNYLAYHDILTDLPNRLLFNDRFNQSMARAARYRTLVAVMLMDLDRFKEINDRYGHRTGDLLLKSVAGRLAGTVRKMDTLSRLWGDEFGILIGDLKHARDVVPITRKILKIFTEPFLVEGHELKISASIGIAFYPDQGDNIEILLRNADHAMYQAKDLGRNRYHIYI